MQNEGSNGTSTTAGDHSGNLPEPDLEKQENIPVLPQEDSHPGSVGDSGCVANPTLLTIVVSNGESHVTQQPIAKLSKDVDSIKEELPCVASPKKGYFSRTTSCHEQCRVCQQEKEEVLIDLGCQCKGGLAKAHRSCIDTWFHTKGSNKCEICQAVAVNVSAPESQPSVGILCLRERASNKNPWIASHSHASIWLSNANSWLWRVDPSFAPQERERGCFSPLWVAFSILIGGLLLDVLISVTLGVSALPVNIIIGVIVVLGLGTALRLALEFCHEWSIRRAVQRVETNATLGYHPAL
ncbi:zinc finger protein [Theobroma cacao]|nr:zinc finger protein [Theobroma cacao]